MKHVLLFIQVSSTQKTLDLLGPFLQRWELGTDPHAIRLALLEVDVITLKCSVQVSNPLLIYLLK